MIKRLFMWLMVNVATQRDPDFIIDNGEPENPYLRRWYVIKRNKVFNIYLHQFLRSDEDEALHDHPWLFNISVILNGSYVEHTINAGGVHVRTRRDAGAIKLRGISPHRVELLPMPSNGAPSKCWTLFITGPKIREWGFHCPKGWKAFGKFYSETDEQGRTAGHRVGCGQ